MNLKKIKRKKEYKDWKKKNNILKQWKRESDNNKITGKIQKRMPCDFPRSKKN